MPRRKFRPIPKLSEKKLAEFQSLIDVRGAEECWPWRGRSSNGYGHGSFSISTEYGDYFAHRLAYFIATGQEPGELKVCHSCDNPPCCNPAHLFLGTHADNMADMKNKGRQCRGERHPRKLHPEFTKHGEQLPQSNLSNEIVWKIRELYASKTMTQKQIADIYGIWPNHVSKIVRRQLWPHI